VTGRELSYLVSIHHPAQAHFYRPIIESLQDRGHDVQVCVRDKEMTAELLDAFEIPHTVLARPREGATGTAVSQGIYETRLCREAWRYQPDVVTSIGGIEISHVAPLVGAKSVAFTDTPSMASRLLTSPFLDVVCTPASFQGTVRGEHRRYEGYHELAYLHPDRFEPDHERLRSHGIDPDSRLFCCRFAGWEAHHDIGEHGFTDQEKEALVSTLSDHGEVYITSEQPLPAAFEQHAFSIPPELGHDLLAAADLYVGDSGTMATEAAVLGTPAVRCASTAGGADMANFVELEESFGLLNSFANGKLAIDAVESLLDRPDLQSTWERRREKLLATKIDVTEYAVGQLEAVAGTATQSKETTHPKLV